MFGNRRVDDPAKVIAELLQGFAWTCPVSVDSLSSSLLVSGLTSLILCRRGVSRRRREKLWFADLTINAHWRPKRLRFAGTP